jgi:hypothetical protein
MDAIEVGARLWPWRTTNRARSLSQDGGKTILGNSGAFGRRPRFGERYSALRVGCPEAIHLPRHLGYPGPLAPHHEPALHAHLLASIPNGYIFESFANPERDPFWSELYDRKPRIEKSILYLDATP